MTDDIVARARAALEGTTPENWQYWDDFDGRRSVDLGGRSDGEFVQQSPELVRELADEVERLRTELDEAWAVIGVDRVTPVVEFGPAGGEMTVQPGSGEPRTLPDALRVLERGSAFLERWRKSAMAERDRLAATVERVRELSMQVAHDPDVEGMTLRDMGAIDHALAVLAALEGPEGAGDE